jgi:hypothetical protein
MRLAALGLIPLVLAGCGAKYKPTGPVLGDYQRSVANPVHKPHDNLRYSGASARSDAPVVPVLAFGAAFDLDVAVMANDDDLDMIEFARMNVPFGDGYVWMALETNVGSGAQTLVANLDADELATFMPELPLVRRAAKMEIEDRTTETTVDVHLNYEGPSGVVDATLMGDAPVKRAKKRNGRTFTHSQNELLAVLDIPSSESLFKADVQIDGRALGQKKIGGLVPGRFSLVQAQGGLASGSFTIVPTEPAYGGRAWGEVAYRAPGDDTPMVKAAPDVLLKQAVATTGFTSVQECWKTRAAEQADLAGGALTFEWAIEAGVVKDVKPKAVEGQTFADEKLSACLVDAIGKWTLDASVQGTAWWTWTFTPAQTNVEDGAGPTVTLGEGGSNLTAPPAPAPEAMPPGSAGERPDDLPEEGAPAPAANAPEPTFKSFSTVHQGADGSTVEMKWVVTVQGERVTASTTDALRSLSYHYRLNGGAYLELVAITVEQYGRATPVTAVTFTPPIPDFRWGFDGKRTSTFVIDVNGQQSHATGEVTAFWSDSGPRLQINPSEPEWAAARPLLADIVFNRDDGTTEVRVTRVGN